MSQLKQQLLIAFLNISKFWQKRRIQDFSYDLTETIDKIGLVPLQHDRELETPATNIPNQPSVIDEISMSGFNSKGDSLIIRLSRRSDDKTEVLLHLNISGKGSYHLPLLPDTRAYTGNPNNFSSCGIKIQCLSAMKKWRISYNGLLRGVVGNNEDSEMVYVKFSFIWSVISIPYDFQTEFSSKLLSEALCNSNSILPFSTLNKLKERSDRYDQWGQYSGTISFDNEEEQEIYLWGPKSRNRGILEWKEIREYLRVYGYMKDGMMFNLGTTSLPGIITNMKYGYIIKPNRFIHSVDACDFDIISEDGEIILERINITAGGRSYEIECSQLKTGCNSYYGGEWDVFNRLRLTSFTIENVCGKGYVEIGIRNTIESPPPMLLKKPCLLHETEIEGCSIPYVVSFREELCENTNVSGGKGSSLAKLTKLSSLIEEESSQKSPFSVPRGVVVTTSAYNYHINENSNLSLEISSLNSVQIQSELEEECKKVIKAFSETNLSESLKDAIRKELEQVFGDELPQIAFAVRSSAAGEDSSETSAAGQMDTYLGIRGIDQLYEKVVRCWSSQFSNVAVNYKRQMGQPIDSGMAVVIQEMIASEVAGVVFTCDPMTGNPSQITITANYGLGESVVSATTEPDTIILRRTINNEVSIHSETIGMKKIAIQMSDAGGTISKVVVEDQSKRCCLNSENAIKIANIAILVEESFGDPRDVEWASVGETIYLLQARPITTCDSETEFELSHEFDSGMLTDFEYFTKANTGEVMPGALTPLTLSTVHLLMDISFQEKLVMRDGRSNSVFHPLFPTTVVNQYNHVFLGMIDTTLRKNSKEEGMMGRNWELSLFGRLLENSKELRQVGIHRYGVISKTEGLKQLLYLLAAIFREEGPSYFVYYPLYNTVLNTYFRHAFLGIIDIICTFRSSRGFDYRNKSGGSKVLFRKNEKEESVMTSSWQISVFGRISEISKELHQAGLRRFGIYPKTKGIKYLIYTFFEIFKLEKAQKSIEEELSTAYLPENMTFASSNQLYTIICQKLPKHCNATGVHGQCSGVSSLLNIFILTILAKIKGNVEHGLFADFASLVCNCENVVSADVPNSLQVLSDAISSSNCREKFVKMSPEEALKWIEKEKGNIGAKYRQFLTQHGHRCLMEFDLSSHPWSLEPIQLIKSLQTMAKRPSRGNKANGKNNVTPSTAVDRLQLPLGPVTRYLLKVLVGWARYAVGQRERSKSNLIKSVDVYRRAYMKLGDLMKKEGRIPDSSLIFYFSHEEIGELLKTRSAHLISKVIRRRRLHSKLDSLRFPEITSGPPKPIQEMTPVDDGNSDWIITGTPIHHGTITAPARVIMKLEEAHNIQPGDILVTYSTDIGWSPYFPILSGVVTELGGLLSHGAVVAREFGLPCIVGAHNATAIVKSGDIVILDGKSGKLRKAGVQSAQNN